MTQMVTQPSGLQDRGANKQLVSISLLVIFTDVYESLEGIFVIMFQQLVYSSFNVLAFHAFYAFHNNNISHRDFGATITFSNKSLDQNQKKAMYCPVPTGQWYAPSAVINDARYCMVGRDGY